MRERSPEELESLLSRLVKQQAKLALQVATVFVGLLLLIPLANLLAPKIAGQNVLGFTATWLLLGVLFYPIIWWLSGRFIAASDQLELEEEQEVEG